MLIDTAQGPVEFPDDTPPEAIEEQLNYLHMVSQRSETPLKSKGGSGNIAQQFLKGATFSLGDEIQGGIGAMFAKMHDLVTGGIGKSDVTGEENTLGSYYDQATGEIRDEMRTYEKENPTKALLAELAGGVVTGIGGGSKMAGSKVFTEGSKLMKAAAVPATAAAEGAAYGFGEGEGFKESVTNMPAAAATSAVVGTTLNQLMKFGGRHLFTKKQAKHLQQNEHPDMSADDLGDIAKKFYKTADESGVKVKAKAYQKWAKETLAEMKAQGVRGRGIPSQVSQAMKEIAGLKNPTYIELEGIKKMLKKGRTNAEPSIRETANELNARVDEFIAQLTPDQVTKGNVENLGDHLKKARNLWHRKAQAEVLEDIQESALISESVIDAGDMDKAVRAGIRTIIKPGSRKRMGIDPEILTGLDEIMKGGMGKNMLRKLSGMAPGSHTARGLIPSGVGAGTGLAAGGPVAAIVGGMAPSVIGGISKEVAGAATNRELNALKNALLNKGQRTVKEIVKELEEKYGPKIGGAAAGLAGASSSELNDLIGSGL